MTMRSALVSDPTHTASAREVALDAASSGPSPVPPSAGALVVELSQLEYAMRARLPRDAWDSAAVDDAFASQLRRRDAILAALRRRGIDFPGAPVQPIPARPPAQGDSTVPGSPLPAGAPAPADVVAELAATVDNLEQAVLTRTVIGQATGILMERHKVTADDAFEMLATASNTTNRKVRDLAVDLVETGLLPGLPGPRNHHY